MSRKFRHKHFFKSDADYVEVLGDKTYVVMRDGRRVDKTGDLTIKMCLNYVALGHWEELT